jgi:hypothetical protein
MILSTLTANLIALGGIAMGRFKYSGGMPMASSFSTAISAACHRPPEDVDAHLKPVQWGVISHEASVEHDVDAVGHCSFSSLPVEMPITGRLYA